MASSRLRESRRPQPCPPDILRKHPKEPLVPFLMRDVQTERECGVGLPVGVTLGELRAAAAVVFGYNRNRWREVKIEYPALGIEEYDKTEDSALTELVSENAWAEVRMSNRGDIRSENLTAIDSLSQATALWRKESAQRRTHKLLNMTNAACHVTKDPNL